MDASVNMPNINLLSARFDNIRAELGEYSKVSGGTLNVTIKTALTKNGVPNQAEGNVSCSLVAFPKGSDSKDKKSFAFKVELAVDGIFEWAKGDEPNLKDDSIEYVLLQSLYIMAITEVVSIAQKLGFPGVSLPLDLKLNRAMAAKTLKKASPAKKVRSVTKIK